MRILTFRELPPGWEADSVLLMHNAFGSSWDPHALSTRRFGTDYPQRAEYVGLGAVERGRIVSSVAVHRFPFRTRRGDCTCSGLGAVATLPTHARRGLARSLIEEAHRRERLSGSPFMLLYTGRSILAHALYESLGYRDVLDFPRAVRPVPRTKRPLPAGWRWRRATHHDRRPIEELRADLGRARCGFTRQGVEWWPGPRRWFGPALQEWFVLERHRHVVGYANLRTEGQVRACHEGMARTEQARGLLLRALESQASGGWLLLGSPVLDELRRAQGMHAYTPEEGSYGVLMAKSLGGSLSRSALVHELGTDCPGFLIGTADAY